MQDIVLIGAGGCMRELVWQILELNSEEPTWRILGYVDQKKPDSEEALVVAGEEILYLGNDDFLLHQTEKINVAICIAEPSVRKRIVAKLSVNSNIFFPNLILANTKICADVKMGQGCIVSMDARISTNVEMGDFVFMNIGSTVCHDGKVGDFVTLSPYVKLAGNVHIGKECNVGMGTMVIQGIRVSEQVVTGAGSVIIKDIEESCTVVGVPARKIKS